MSNIFEIKNFKHVFGFYNLICLVLILIVFFSDRLTKLSVLKDYSDSAHYINDFVNLDLIWNTGIGFGLLSSNSTIVYNSISILIFIILIFLVYLAINSDRYEKLIFSIIIGGALGNFYDRVSLKAVPDFIDLHYGSFHWFTFNVADIFITIGIILLLMNNLKTKKNIK